VSQKGNKENLALVFVYSKDFMERVIRNLINDPETKEPILHIGGFTIREVDKAIEKERARIKKENGS
jgi:hypothetical protein